MIKIIQPGVEGSTRLLIDMHRTRAKIFKERMGWDVAINEMGMEIDQYDLPDTIYILSMDNDGQVIGTWRILPTNRPSMIRDLWPQYLETLPIPQHPNMCEASRFGVYSEALNSDERSHLVNRATSEMIIALIDVCLKCGITDMFTFYDKSIKRLLDRIGFTPVQTSEIISFEGRLALTARFSMTEELLENVRSHTGLKLAIKPNELPPLLLQRYQKNQPGHLNGEKYAAS